jgi:hypothetical protein
MEGGTDPDCRRAMLWKPATWNHDLLAAMKRYIALRKKYLALWQRGTYMRLHAQGMVYAFARQRDRQTVIVGVNAGKSDVRLDVDVHHLLPNGAAVRNEWDGQQYTVMEGHLRHMLLPARSGDVWVAESHGR